MNLALGVLVIFIIAIPGIVFRLTYLSSTYSKRFINTTAVDEIFNSLVPAFIFHALFILIIALFNYQVDFQFIYNLLIGNSAAKNINDLNKYLGHFMLYMLANIAVNFGAALLLRWLVLKYKWYQKVQILAIYNVWYFKLKPPPLNGEKLSVWVDVLVETKNESILYRGFLVDFRLNKDGGLDELDLEDVRRRIFSNDQQHSEYNAVESPGDHTFEEEDEVSIFQPDSVEAIDKRYYYIPGELFIIKYADVKNLNIWYYAESISDN